MQPFYFGLLYFIGMWILVTYILSKFGWAKLAANYKALDKFTGNSVGIISASINMISYRNALVLKYNKEGIYLKTIIFFKLFHEPVLIPWQEIKEVRERNFLFFKSNQLVIGSPLVAKITVSRWTFSKFEREYLSHPFSK